MLHISKIFIILLTFSTGSITTYDVIDRALHLSLLPTNAIATQDARTICDQAIEQVIACNYEEALKIIIEGLETFPHNFRIQSYFATLLGDHSENFTGEIKEKMEQKAKDIFNKLMKELGKQSLAEKYQFKNEYFFRFAEYKNQYENGLEMISHNKQGLSIINGYYYQGVGAAHYAKQLFIENQKKLAMEYAQKALVAWAQYFSYENDYYNSYVHYALALFILGYKEEMLRALQRSATLINRDLTYHEFAEIIHFSEKHTS
jgi:hypothetical protein